MRVADEGLLPLLPNSDGQSRRGPPVQTYGPRSQRQIDTNAIGRDRGGEGSFVGEFPPVAAFPSMPEHHADSAGHGGSMASSRGFISAGSLKSSRGFLSRTLASARKPSKGADFAGCPPGGMRFFANPLIEEPLVASVGKSVSPSSSEDKKREVGTGRPLEAGRPAPLEVNRPASLERQQPPPRLDGKHDGDGFEPASPSSPGSPLSPKTISFEEKLEQKAGVALHTLHLGDLRRSKSLRMEMQALKLHDYFDNRGTPRFRRLGLSFAAKQNEEVKDSFGSIIKNEDQEANKRTFSAKSYFCATQAILKDIHHGEELKLQTLKAVDEMERFRVEDVQLRQLEMLFLEVPNFERYMPIDVIRGELLPPTIDKDAESKERKSSERSTSYLADTRWVEGRRMGWMMTRYEALMLSDFSVLWTRASRTNNCPFGMDRPTFCRMILDLGLVDQQKVPYYWAISLFDSMAQAVRCCPPDATWSHSAPAAFVVNRWALLSIFDTLLRQHYDESTKAEFFVNLQQVAAAKLPAHLSASVQELIKKNKERPDSKANGRDRGKKTTGPGAEDKFGVGKSGSKLRNKVQAAQVHFKMLANVMVGFQKAGDLEIDDDGTKNVHNLGKVEEEEKDEKKDVQQEEHVTIPAWLKPPELSAPNLDTAIERLARDRLVGGMLVEPEVLHLVAEFDAPFREMHKVYSEENGHMSFQKLLQFCHDFRLTPQLVSSDLLQGAYAAVQNIELRREVMSRQTTQEASASSRASKAALEESFPKRPSQQRDVDPATEPNTPTSPKTRGPWSSRRSVKKKGSKDIRRFDTMPEEDRRQADSTSPQHPSMAESLRAAFKRSSTGLSSKRGSLGTEVEKASLTNTWPKDSADLKAAAAEATSEQDKQQRGRGSRDSSRESRDSDLDKRRLSLPNVIRNLQKQARMERRRSSNDLEELEPLAEVPEKVVLIFGVGAFLEALCRVAFMHLGSYGNIVQQSSTAYARVVWLITYLRYIFDHLRTKSEEFAASGETCKAPENCSVCRKPLEPGQKFCRECGSKVTQEPAVPSLLLKALQTMPQNWAKPPDIVPEEIPLGEAVVHPEPGVGCKRKRRRARATTQNNHPRLAPSMHTSPEIRKKLCNLARNAKEHVAERRKSGDRAERKPTRKRTSLIRSSSKEPVPPPTCRCGKLFPEGQEMCPDCGMEKSEARILQAAGHGSPGNASHGSPGNTCTCGNVFRDDADFCRKCGAKRFSSTVSEAPPGYALHTVCKCGNTFLPDALFCRKCGAKRPKKPEQAKPSNREGGSRPESVDTLADPSSSDESLHQEDGQKLSPSSDRKKEIETPVAKGRRVSSNKATHADLQRQTKDLLSKAPSQKESWSLDELFEAEAGKSCVLDGRCSICEGEAGVRRWGNARCRGCSIVDYFPFDHHPFKMALKESCRPKSSSEPGTLATDLPPGVEKYALTPPPVGDLNSVLEKYFGHNKNSIEAIS